MTPPLPDSGSVPTPFSMGFDGTDPQMAFRGALHSQGNPHAPDPERTSWQLPGRGIIGKFAAMFK